MRLKKSQEQEVIKDSIRFFIEKLRSQETILKNFDETLWTSTIEKVVIKEEKTIFYFKDVTEITL